MSIGQQLIISSLLEVSASCNHVSQLHWFMHELVKMAIAFFNALQQPVCKHVSARTDSSRHLQTSPMYGCIHQSILTLKLNITYVC